MDENSNNRVSEIVRNFGLEIETIQKHNRNQSKRPGGAVSILSDMPSGGM